MFLPSIFRQFPAQADHPLSQLLPAWLVFLEPTPAPCIRDTLYTWLVTLLACVSADAKPMRLSGCLLHLNFDLAPMSWMNRLVSSMLVFVVFANYSFARQPHVHLAAEMDRGLQTSPVDTQEHNLDDPFFSTSDCNSSHTSKRSCSQSQTQVVTAALTPQDAVLAGLYSGWKVA